MQRKLKLKFNTFLKVYDVNLPENNKKELFKMFLKGHNIISLYLSICRIFVYETLQSKKTDLGFMEYWTNFLICETAKIKSDKTKYFKMYWIWRINGAGFGHRCNRTSKWTLTNLLLRQFYKWEYCESDEDGLVEICLQDKTPQKHVPITLVGIAYYKSHVLGSYWLM